MLICGDQSIVDVTTEEVIPSEDGPSALVVFTVRVETYGFTATQQIRIDQRDARTFVSHLRAIERVRQASATLSAPQKEEFELRIGFIPDSGRVMASGRLSAWDAGLSAPVLDYVVADRVDAVHADHQEAAGLFELGPKPHSLGRRCR